MLEINWCFICIVRGDRDKSFAGPRMLEWWLCWSMQKSSTLFLVCIFLFLWLGSCHSVGNIVDLATGHRERLICIWFRLASARGRSSKSRTREFDCRAYHEDFQFGKTEFFESHIKCTAQIWDMQKLFDLNFKIIGCLSFLLQMQIFKGARVRNTLRRVNASSAQQ